MRARDTGSCCVESAKGSFWSGRCRAASNHGLKLRENRELKSDDVIMSEVTLSGGGGMHVLRVTSQGPARRVTDEWKS